MAAARFLTSPGVLSAVFGLVALTSPSRAAADTGIGATVLKPPAGALVTELVARPAVGYRRGRPMKLRVVTVGWADVELRTARAFLAMRQAAARSGIDLWINSGYRTHEQQTLLYRAWREGWGNGAARPGYSKHQSGRALDLDVRDPATFAWLKRHARRFGFRRTVRSEPWHWVHFRRRDKIQRTITASVSRDHRQP
jgi:hypothetical protein